MSEEENERTKCSKDGYCKFMAERLGENNRTTKGFAALTLVDMKTRRVFVTTPAYYMGGKDKGLFIKYCPFCGAAMDPIRKAWSKEDIMRNRNK